VLLVEKIPVVFNKMLVQHFQLIYSRLINGGSRTIYVFILSNEA